MHIRPLRGPFASGLGLALVASMATLCASPQTPAPAAQPPAGQQPPPAATPSQPTPAQQPPAQQAPAQQPPAAAAPQPAPQAPAGQAPAQPPAAPSGVQAAPGVDVPADYVIGPEDVLAVMYWKDADMSADVTVRPDGQITLPLLNEVTAAGLTPEQLRAKVTTLATKFVEDPTVTIVVKAINSRKVFITGMVGRPGPYPLTGPTSVLQLIAMAGGVQEFADTKNITILRQENGRQVAHPFNYKDVMKRKNLEQNIELKPGDTIIVP